MSNLRMDAEAEKEKIKELIKSLYHITDEDVLESFARDSMEFDVENKYDAEGDDYVKPYGVEDSSDNIVKAPPFESLLKSKSVEENKNTINKHVIFEPLEVDIDDDFKSNDLDYIFYDDCVNDRYSGYTVDNETRFQEDFKRSEEMRFLGFESELMNNHNRYIEEHGYDAFVELQREIYYDRYSRESDSKVNEFENKMHDLDEDLINNKDFGLKL